MHSTIVITLLRQNQIHVYMGGGHYILISCLDEDSIVFYYFVEVLGFSCRSSVVFLSFCRSSGFLTSCRSSVSLPFCRSSVFLHLVAVVFLYHSVGVVGF